MTPLPSWSGFPSEYTRLLFIEPTDDLYLKLGSRFIELQTELLGNFNCFFFFFFGKLYLILSIKNFNIFCVLDTKIFLEHILGICEF